MITLQFIRFLVVGGIAAGANFGSRFIFSIFFDYSVSIILAFLVGMLVAFILMRGHVFNSKSSPIGLQLTKFVFVNLFAALQTLIISLLMAHRLLPTIGIEKNTEALGHMIGVSVPVVTSYFGHKFLTFR